MPHHDSVREEYESLVKSRDEHSDLSYQAFQKDNYEEAFRHRREVLKEEKKLSDLMSEVSDRGEYSRGASHSPSLLQVDDYSYRSRLLLLDSADEWED